MVNFEDNEGSTIGPDDLAAVIGREENQRLEFKKTIVSTPAPEIARDVSSFANAEGGFIIIGCMEDAKTKKSTGFYSLPDTEAVRKKLRDACAKYIDEPLAVFPTALQTNAGENIVVLFVPKSPSLRAVVFDGKTEFWKRVGVDKRPMNPAEIRARMNQAQNAADLLLAQRRLASDLTRWNEITNREVLWEALDARFKSIIGGAPYLRLTITPHDLRDGLVDISNQDLKTFLWYPTVGQREAGWNVRVGPFGSQIVSDSVGLHSEKTEVVSIHLTRSGHLEFWAPIDPSLFCWQQSLDEYAKAPRLWPTAVVEFPASFLRFAKELYRRLKTDCEFSWRMEYRNIQGALLYPYLPVSPALLDGPRRFPITDFEPREVRLDRDFDADPAAFGMVVKFYEVFGFSRKQVPYFIDGKIAPERFGY